MAVYRLRLLLSLNRGSLGISPSPFSHSCKFCSSSGSSQIERVGFIGLGNMGSRMANNLIKAGYNVVVHDINHEAVEAFSKKGILAKKSPIEVAEESDALITMLPSSAHVMEVYTGKKGGGDTPAMLDAPVSGGIISAENGTLTFMVGGSEEAYRSARPLFQSMGKNIIYCGGPGNGSAAKICNNLAMAVSMLGVSEAFALGQSLGIGANTLTQIFNSSSARCWSSDTYNPVPGVMDGVPASRSYEGGFATKLMAKDLKLAATSAEEVGARIQATSLAQQIFTGLCEGGCGSKDFSCVFRHYFHGKDEV